MGTFNQAFLVTNGIAVAVSLSYYTEEVFRMFTNYIYDDTFS